MKNKTAAWIWCATAAAGLGLTTARLGATDPETDFGLFVQETLHDKVAPLFGIRAALAESAHGPYDGNDAAASIDVADGLRVSVVSTAVAPTADMIALWPNDARPTHLFVCIEAGGDPSVQRIDLSKPADANATTIVTGLAACDPVRRTAWGTIVVGEETTSGGLYEIFRPAAPFSTPVVVTNRATGATSDPLRVAKRQAVGQLAFEGNPILADGTTYYGDELRPGGGNPGGAIYKFVPDFPYSGSGGVASLANSPLASGKVYGLKVGTSDNGQGTEIGRGAWLPIDTSVTSAIRDANGNFVLRSAQAALKLTGYYRPEDMDIDPIALARGEVRACWTNTGNMSNGGGSAVEKNAILGEVMCLTDDMSSGTAVPEVRRFIAGDHQANYFDNVAFQPHTGNLVVLEDGEVDVVRADGTHELRGNDIWMCLPDGADRDVQSDGCVRIVSLRDTSAEPTGFIFAASGTEAYVNIQHRNQGKGALLKISGFRIPE